MNDFRWWKKACAVFVVCAATGISAEAQTFTSLVSFGGGNGAYPQMSLIQGADGALYGTAEYGGHGGCGEGCGTAFKVNSGGTLTHLDLNGPDGTTPESG